MAFQSISDFISMGEHGQFVWSAWAVFFGAVLLLLVFLCNERTSLKKRIVKNRRKQVLLHNDINNQDNMR